MRRWRVGALILGTIFAVWFVMSILVARIASATPIEQRWKSADLLAHPIAPFFEVAGETESLWRPLPPISTTWRAGMPQNERISVLDLPPGCTRVSLRTTMREIWGEGVVLESVSPFNRLVTPAPVFLVGACQGTPATIVPEPGMVGLVAGVVLLAALRRRRSLHALRESENRRGGAAQELGQAR